MSKKVLFVATVVKTHINVFHLPYLKWFKEQGYETHVCAKDDFNDEQVNIPNCDRYFNTPFERSPFNKKNIKAYRELKKVINNNKYEIIHCHTPVAAILTRLASRTARECGTKVIYTAHGFHFFKGAPLINWLIYFPVEWLCSWLTDVLITINKEDYKLAEKFFHSRSVKYVPGVGIDDKKIKKLDIDINKKKKEIGVPINSITLLSVGELNKNKNHIMIINALKQLNNSNIHFCIAGRGELEDSLKRFSIDLGLEKQVHFLGYRKDVLELYQIADVFCFPSIREGLSVSLMEAMASGLPVICSDIRGNNDLIKHDYNGYLCEKNSVESYVYMINRLLNDCEKMKEIKKNNIKDSQKYNQENILNKVASIYKCIVQEG